MRLNSALASSFLFVPIVFADYRPREHQPRSPNSVDKNIDASTDQVPWAGAVLPEGNEACHFCTGGYTAVNGTFNAPLASGEHGIAISVGIGGSVQCPDSNIGFAAGIDVLLGDNNAVSYTGWAKWGDQSNPGVSPLKPFDIATGDLIQASVYLFSATTGSAILENLSNGQSWGQFFIIDEPAVCQRSAEWVVTALANYPADDVPIPKFSTVTFMDATATIDGGTVMPGPGGATISSITYNNTLLATAIADGSVVVVTYMV